MALVNCEEYTWLEVPSADPKYDKMPDLLLCHPCFYESRPPSAARPPAEALRNDDFKFGVLEHKCLQDSVGAVFEAKVRIGANNTTFGEVINYGRLLAVSGSCSRQLQRVQRVVLFDKVEFWLFKFTAGVLASVIQCGWTTPGSRNLLVDFISHKSNWVTLLDAACTDLSVTAVPGRSFTIQAVRGQDQGDELALKVVVNNDELQTDLGASNMLRLEQDYLTRARRAAPHLVPASYTEIFDGPEGSALVLTTAGRPITDTKAYFDRAFNALVELHRLGIVHGDPRLANAVVVGRGQINWIVFNSARFSEQSILRFRQDMIVFVRSCFISSAGSQSPIPLKS